MPFPISVLSLPPSLSLSSVSLFLWPTSSVLSMKCRGITIVSDILQFSNKILKENFSTGCVVSVYIVALSIPPHRPGKFGFPSS